MPEGSERVVVPPNYHTLEDICAKLIAPAVFQYQLRDSVVFILIQSKRSVRTFPFPLNSQKYSELVYDIVEPALLDSACGGGAPSPGSSLSLNSSLEYPFCDVC